MRERLCIHGQKLKGRAWHNRTANDLGVLLKGCVRDNEHSL
jgi:hypothetical protein